MLSPSSSTFRVMSEKQIRAHFKAHIQTARIPHILNMTYTALRNEFLCKNANLANNALREAV